MANQQGRTSRARTRTTRTQSTQSTSRSMSSSGVAVTADAEEVRVYREVDWAGEYHHVFSDIRHLLVVSGVLFALLLVVGFFL
jgi:hypothetical protein